MMRSSRSLWYLPVVAVVLMACGGGGGGKVSPDTAMMQPQAAPAESMPMAQPESAQMAKPDTTKMAPGAAKP